MFSFYETKQEFVDCLDTVLLKLTSIWDEIGIVGDACTVRKRAVILHLSNLLEEMVGEEEAMRQRVLENIQQFSADLKQLCRELGAAEYQVRRAVLCAAVKYVRYHACTHTTVHYVGHRLHVQ